MQKATRYSAHSLQKLHVPVLSSSFCYLKSLHFLVLSLPALAILFYSMIEACLLNICCLVQTITHRCMLQMCGQMKLSVCICCFRNR